MPLRNTSGQGTLTIPNVSYSPYENLAGKTAYKGTLHAHTTGSDGSGTAAEMMNAYKAAGMDFAALTDHDAATADPEVGGILFVPGIEESATDNTCGIGHIVCLGDVANDGTHVTQTIISASPGPPFIAHPSVSTKYYTVAEIESYSGLSLIDIWNTSEGGTKEKGDYTTLRWDRLLDDGRRFYGVHSDDAHSVAVACSKGHQVVYATAPLTLAKLYAALLAGQSYATQGPLFTSISTTDKTLTVVTPDVCTFEFLATGSVTRKWVLDATTASYSWGHSDTWVRCVAQRGSDGFKAWTQPVFLA